MTRPVVIVAEHAHGALHPAMPEVAVCARLVAGHLGKPLAAVVVGADPEAAAAALGRAEDIPVTAVTVDGLNDYHASAEARVLGRVLGEWQPAVVCMGNTGHGLEVAAHLAMDLAGACITAVEGIDAGDGGIGYRSPLFGGKRSAVWVAETPVTVITVQPGCFQGGGSPGSGQPPEIRHVRVSLPAVPDTLVGTEVASVQDLSIADARVVITAGNGVREREDLAIFRSLAHRLSNAVVAGSRPVCDKGWLPHHLQVGITGNTVSPEVYIACGVSGAFQHVSAISGSDLIVAVNTDPNAAIANHSDLFVQEDLHRFLPELIEALNARTAGVAAGLDDR